MSDAVGLSIGTLNMVAATPGRPPLSRRSVLTLWDDTRPPDIGVPSQNPELTSPNVTAAGVVLRGFVERVGDPVPLVASDGSVHRGEALVALGLDALVRAAGDADHRINGPDAVVVAAPAHWGPAAIGALRGALRDRLALSVGGVPPMIVSDATAALTALAQSPGLPGRGVVALCDFGAAGTSISLADAGAHFAPIGETARVAEFSGDQIDQALLNHVLSDIRSGGPDDTGGTAAVGPLTRLRAECRAAKERLSADTVTAVTAELPGMRSEIRLTRAELEDVIAAPLAGFLDALADTLERNRIPVVSLAAVATAGGGAAIPLIAQKLSETLRVPVISRPQPGLTAAAGAALLAAGGPAADAATQIGVGAADAPTGLAPAAWAASTAGRAAGESASDGSPSATFRALAWSQDEDGAAEPLPYEGGDVNDTLPPPTGSRPMVEFDTDEHITDSAPALLPWYRRPALIFGIAAAFAAVAVGTLAVRLTDSPSTPTTTTTRVTAPGEESTGGPSPVPPPPPTTITVTGSNGQTTVNTVTPSTTAAPPPPPSSSETLTSTTTTTTTTTTTPPTTTTTTPTTTRTTTTTTPPPTTTTSAAPPTTTAPPPTTTAAPPTTTAAPVVTTTAAPPVTTQAVVSEPVVTTAATPPQ